jgi:MYXO-CTERM domain-containing protein
MVQHESDRIRRTLARMLLGLTLLSAGVAVPASAQGDAGSAGANTGTSNNSNNNDHGNWGWLGLLGLAGLAGLRRRDRVDTTAPRR